MNKEREIDLSLVDWNGMERYLGCRQALLEVLRIREQLWEKGKPDVYVLMVLSGVEHYLMAETVEAKGNRMFAEQSAVKMWEEDVYDVDNINL